MIFNEISVADDQRKLVASVFAAAVVSFNHLAGLLHVFDYSCGQVSYISGA